MDASLRNVAIPPGLVARLKSVAAPADEELDAVLRATPVPNGLVDRVKEEWRETYVDESLRAVEIPADLLARLRVIPECRHESSFRRFVLAASLLLVMTGTFFGALGGVLASIRPRSAQTTSLTVIKVGPTQLVASPAESVRISSTNSSVLFPLDTTPVVWKGRSLQVDLVRLDETMRPGPAGQLILELEGGLQLGSNVLLMRWDAYASPEQVTQRLPEFERVERRPDAGVDLPLVAGYDRAFLHRTSTHPPVFAAESERLQTIRVPVTTSVASLERTEQLLEQGRLPDPQELHAEDFIAAIEFDYPAVRDDEATVFIAAGPTPFGDKKSSLVQVGVKAARRMGSQPAHVAVVVDVSQSMLQEGRIDVVRDSLRTMFDHLDVGDSVSLLAVNHDLTQQLDFATSEDRELLDGWLRLLRSGGGDRPVLGLRAGLALALNAPREEGVLRQVIFVTDGTTTLRASEVEAFEEVAAQAESNAIRMNVLHLGGIVKGTRPAAASLSYESVDSNSLRWKLVEFVTGVSPLVARQAELEITFNPNAVRAYRLVGHGPSSMTGLLHELPDDSLRSGQQATLVFEVWLTGSYEDDIASAALNWVAPDSEQWRRSGTAVLGRYDVTTRRDKASAGLLAAAIATEIGERLCGVGDFELTGESEFRARRKGASWKNVVDAAWELVGEIECPEGFVRLKELVERVEALRKPPAETSTM